MFCKVFVVMFFCHLFVVVFVLFVILLSFCQLLSFGLSVFHVPICWSRKEVLERFLSGGQRWWPQPDTEPVVGKGCGIAKHLLSKRYTYTPQCTSIYGLMVSI